MVPDPGSDSRVVLSTAAWVKLITNAGSAAQDGALGVDLKLPGTSGIPGALAVGQDGTIVVAAAAKSASVPSRVFRARLTASGLAGGWTDISDSLWHNAVSQAKELAIGPEGRLYAALGGGMLVLDPAVNPGPDAGPITDAGPQPDSIAVADATAGPDAVVAPDTTLPVDGAIADTEAADRGPAADGQPGHDGTVLTEAGMALDSSTRDLSAADARGEQGPGTDGATARSLSGGCGCHVAAAEPGPRPWPLVLGLLVGCLRRRRQRTRLADDRDGVSAETANGRLTGLHRRH